MKLYKYRPIFLIGFDDVCYEVNTEEEFLSCGLIKPIIENKNFYRLSRSYEPKKKKMYLMAEMDEGKNFYVVSIVRGDKDIKQLMQWVTNIFKL